MSQRELMVVIEGGDAMGKRTQSTRLAEKLGGTRFAFPNYESPTGKLILSHLKKEWECLAPCQDEACIATEHMVEVKGKYTYIHPELPNHADARVFQSLQSVNRLESMPAIEEARTQGPVVFDRYWQSSYVYGRIDGLDGEWLRLTQERPMPMATINILLDAPVATGFERRPERRDRYEKNRELLEKVRVEYLKLWGPHVSFEWRNQSQYQFVEQRFGWYVVNGLGTVDEVQERIMTIVNRYRG